MSKSVVVTARIDPQLSERIDRLAQRLDRSRAWLIQQAIERYVGEEAAFLDFVQEGVDAADRGELLRQDEMQAWLDGRSHRAAAE